MSTKSVSRKINVTSLRLFLRVLEMGTIAGAAAVENLVPAAVSKRIHDLEEYLGARLFSRTNKGIRATPAGEMLADLARDPLQSLDRLRWQLLATAGTRQETIRVCASDSAVSQFLPEAIRTFCVKNANVQIRIRSGTTEEAVSALLSGGADIAVYVAGLQFPELATFSTGRDRLVVISSTSCRLGRQDDIQFSGVLDHEFIGATNTGSIRLLLERAAAAAGRPLRCPVLVSTFEAQCALVSAGMGIAVVPEVVAERHAVAFGLKFAPLRDPWAFREFEVATLASGSLSRVASSFVSHLSNVETKNLQIGRVIMNAGSETQTEQHRP